MKYCKKKKWMIILISIMIGVGGVCSLIKWNSKEEKENKNLKKQAISIDWKNQNFCCYISGIEGKKALTTKKARYSDLNILAVVNPSKHEILLVNTPRDTLLTVPKTAKKNAGKPEKLDAMPLYGKRITQKVLQDLYGADIDCSVEINYPALKEIVDALGGVSVYSECDFSSDWGHEFRKGMNNVNGEQALSFARERHHLPEGDMQRGRNQQYLIQAIFKKIREEVSIDMYQKLLSIIQDSVATDLSKKSLKELLEWQLVDRTEWKIDSVGIAGTPSAAITASSEGGEIYVLKPDIDSVTEVSQKIKEYIE